jgi:hypothetical protein
MHKYKDSDFGFSAGSKSEKYHLFKFSWRICTDPNILFFGPKNV